MIAVHVLLPQDLFLTGKKRHGRLSGVAKKFLKKITDNYYPIPSTEELQSFPSTNPIELGPHERHFEDLFFKDFSIPVNDENEINVRGIQFGIRIDYEDQNNNPHFYEVWGHFDKYEYTIIDSSKME